MLVPDAACVLAPAVECVYDDAPWLTGGGSGGGGSGGADAAAPRRPTPLRKRSVGAAGDDDGDTDDGTDDDDGDASAAALAPAERRRFVHPTLSNRVSAAVGAASLRSLTLASTASLLALAPTLPGGVTAEAFGQAEPLTRRLRGILELYPEGPAGTLFEAVQ